MDLKSHLIILIFFEYCALAPRRSIFATLVLPHNINHNQQEIVMKIAKLLATSLVAMVAAGAVSAAGVGLATIKTHSQYTRTRENFGDEK